MGHKNTGGSLTRQIQVALDNKLAIGESKHLDKIAGTASDKIYSWETYHSYISHANYFGDWCKENFKCKTLDDCRPHVDAWIKSLEDKNLSAYTIKGYTAAVAKVYGCSTTDFRATPARIRSNITRSRGEKVRDKHFSEERNKSLVDFCKGTGLRREELRCLTGDKLRYINEKPYILVDSGSKGGRERLAPVIQNQEHVVRMMEEAGTGKVFEKLPNGADIHGYRADYATAYYNQIARPIESIPYDRVNRGTGHPYQSDVYHCRGDQQGTKFDKVAMQQVSQALGHNRISVIGEHYLRG